MNWRRCGEHDEHRHRHHHYHQLRCWSLSLSLAASFVAMTWPSANLHAITKCVCVCVWGGCNMSPVAVICHMDVRARARYFRHHSNRSPMLVPLPFISQKFIHFPYATSSVDVFSLLLLILGRTVTVFSMVACIPFSLWQIYKWINGDDRDMNGSGKTKTKSFHVHTYIEHCTIFNDVTDIIDTQIDVKYVFIIVCVMCWNSWWFILYTRQHVDKCIGASPTQHRSLLFCGATSLRSCLDDDSNNNNRCAWIHWPASRRRPLVPPA